MTHVHSQHVHGENPHAGQGAVLLDIGGDVGALVVNMPRELVGTEVEIRPADGSPPAGHHHPHVAVVLRPTADGPVPSLVYPQVATGDYDLVAIGDETRTLRVSVAGGHVSTVDWD